MTTVGSDRRTITMHLGLCITLLAFLAVHDCWAQNLAAIDRLIDSVANPPLDRNEALRFEREEIDGIRLSETDAPVRCEFRFRNEGTKPLVITHVATSCGCTVADFDRSPVLPGRQGTVAVIYKPAGQSGNGFKRFCLHKRVVGPSFNPAAAVGRGDSAKPVPRLSGNHGAAAEQTVEGAVRDDLAR